MNVTALVEDDGDVVERYMYDPYGKVTVLDADFSEDADGKSDYDNSILFAGYYHDWETGLYHVRNRYYHTRLGWITRDPAGYADGMSLYEYCGSRALTAVDPFGTKNKKFVDSKTWPSWVPFLGYDVEWELDAKEKQKIKDLEALIQRTKEAKNEGKMDPKQALAVIAWAEKYIQAIKDWIPSDRSPAPYGPTFDFEEYEGTKPEWKKMLKAGAEGFKLEFTVGLISEAAKGMGEPQAPKGGTTTSTPSDMTGTYTCVYDAWNRLVEVKANDNGSPGTIVATYRYDAAGRLITAGPGAR